MGGNRANRVDGMGNYKTALDAHQECFRIDEKANDFMRTDLDSDRH